MQNVLEPAEGVINPGYKFLEFHTVFGEIWHPRLGEILDPPLKLIIESTCSIEINLCKFGQIKSDLFQLNKYDY